MNNTEKESEILRTCVVNRMNRFTYRSSIYQIVDGNLAGKEIVVSSSSEDGTRLTVEHKGKFYSAKFTGGYDFY